jgi:putative ABC transport system ATP-binding protein
MEEIVRLEKVTKEYVAGEVKVSALNGVDLTVKRGEFTALAGPSGSGKSTLLNLIAGIDRPTSGRVFIAGKDTASLSSRQTSRLRRERVGLVFQANNLLPVLTAEENAEYVLLLQGRPASERRRRVLEVLEWVGLKGLEKRFPRELSGGQQQRVAIARAVAAAPDLVLADEPTASVDSRTAGGILDLMERLNREQGITFFFSTHDPAVMQRASRTLVLKDGVIASDRGKTPAGDD